MHGKFLLSLLVLVGIIGISRLDPDDVGNLIRSWNSIGPSIEQATAPPPESIPDSHLLIGVPWIPQEEAYCSPSALMMIGHSLGIEQQLGYFNFLMGFTYSAFYCPSCDYSMPWVFPSPLDGFALAAPYLGLRMRHLGTDSLNVFLDSIRFHLSEGRPVVVNLDGSKLLGRPSIYPHTELLVGYNQLGFSYLETQAAPQQGLRDTISFMGAAELAESVQAYNEHFRYPLGYAFIIFEPAKTREGLSAAWNRAGSGLVGKATGNVLSGSYALEKVASDLETGALDLARIGAFLEELIYTRRHDAEFLLQFGAEHPQLLHAAQLLGGASDMYSLTLDSLAGNCESGVGSPEQLIRIAAQAERSAGEILRQHIENGT
jgi:hypothetical protein